MYEYYFFDMDGTLIQSEYGVFDTFIYTLDRYGIKIDDRASLRKCVGPPLYHSFTEFFGMDDATANEAVEYYREQYKKKGIYESPLYDGMYDTLQTLYNMGKKLVIVTSKPENSARVVAEFHKIDKFFAGINAPSEADSSNCEKVDLIRQAMQDMGVDDLSTVVMVGDRVYDIDGAVKAGIDSIGALYGYGSREELEKAKATYIVDSPQDILNI